MAFICPGSEQVHGSEGAESRELVRAVSQHRGEAVLGSPAELPSLAVLALHVT